MLQKLPERAVARGTHASAVLPLGSSRSSPALHRLCVPVKAASDTAAIEDEIAETIKRPQSWLAGNIQLDAEAEKRAIQKLQKDKAYASPGDRRSVRTRTGRAAANLEADQASSQAFLPDPRALDEGVILNSAAFCGTEPQWFAFQVHYPGDTYRALNDAKRVTKVAAWLKNAEINLGPVQLPDGSEIERVIEPLVPRKQVTAYNPRTEKMGKKSVVFANGDLMLFRAVMDNRLAWLLEKHSENVSQKIDERMEMIAGMRPKGEKARAIKVTVFKRWHQSQQLELRPGDVLLPDDHIFQGNADNDLLEDVFRNHMRRKKVHHLPLANPDVHAEATKWLDEKEVWDKARIMQGIMPEPEEPAPEAAPSRQEATSSPQQATASGAPRADAGDAVQQGSAEDLEAQAGAAGAITQQSTATPTSPEGGVDVPTLETPEASGTSEAAVPGVTGLQPAQGSRKTKATSPSNATGSHSAQQLQQEVQGLQDSFPSFQRRERATPDMQAAVDSSDRFAIADALLDQHEASPGGWTTSVPSRDTRHRTARVEDPGRGDGYREDYRRDERRREEQPRRAFGSDEWRREEQPRRALDTAGRAPAGNQFAASWIVEEPREAAPLTGGPAPKGRSRTQPGQPRMAGSSARTHGSGEQPVPAQAGPSGPSLRGRGQAAITAKQLQERLHEEAQARAKQAADRQRSGLDQDFTPRGRGFEPQGRSFAPPGDRPAPQRGWAEWQAGDAEDDGDGGGEIWGGRGGQRGGDRAPAWAQDTPPARPRFASGPGGRSAQQPSRPDLEEPMDDDAFFAALDEKLQASEDRSAAASLAEPKRPAGGSKDAQRRPSPSSTPRASRFPTYSDLSPGISSRDDEVEDAPTPDVSMDEPWLQGGFLDRAAEQPSARRSGEGGGWFESTYKPPEEAPDSQPRKPPPSDWDNSAGAAAADYYGSRGRDQGPGWTSFEPEPQSRPPRAREGDAGGRRGGPSGPLGGGSRGQQAGGRGARRRADDDEGAEQAYKLQIPQPKRPAPVRAPRGDPQAPQEHPPTPRARDARPANPFAADRPGDMDMDLDW